MTIQAGYSASSRNISIGENSDTTLTYELKTKDNKKLSLEFLYPEMKFSHTLDREDLIVLKEELLNLKEQIQSKNDDTCASLLNNRINHALRYLVVEYRI